jgi:parvulin-like peptidyl-prolyl isomerase
MLKLLRKQKNAKKIFYVLAIIIVPSFILWGSATVIKDNDSKGYAGKIFGKKVSFEQYMNALSAWRNQLVMKFGDQARQLENILDSNQAVWEKLILLQEAKRLKIKISNEELTQYITSIPFLQKNGVFEPESYELFLKYSLSTPPRVFEEQIREALMAQKLFDFVTDDVQVADDEVKEKYKQQNEQIKVKYIAVLSKDLESQVTSSEPEQIEYYEKQKDGFIVPIEINLNYAFINYPDNATEEQKSDIEKRIRQLRDSVKSSKNFKDLQEKHGLQIKETGFFILGDSILEIAITPKELVELFNFKQGEISDIFQTPKGPYIFELKEKRTNYLPPFQEVKEKVLAGLTKIKSKELAKSKIEQYYSKVKAEKESKPESSLSKILDKMNLAVKETDLFNRSKPPFEVDDPSAFNQIAFNLKTGEISGVIELNEGYCIVELLDYKPINEEEFQKEKENLRKAILEEKKDKAFEGYFIKLKEKANLTDYISSQKKTSK